MTTSSFDFLVTVKIACSHDIKDRELQHIINI